ncbi:MAG: YceI family protein [Pyrinomonadaceae bacterium]
MTGEAENAGMRYRIDAGRGSFTVQAFAEGLLSFVGHNPTFAVRRYGGEIQFAADNIKVDSMLLVAQADTILLIDRMSEKDKAEIENTMRDNVLEIVRFPEIVFVSQDIAMEKNAAGKFQVRVSGNLSLHGVTRRHLIEAAAEINRENLRAKGEFTLRLSDYDIKPVKALGGTLKVKDEIKLSFDITAKI